MTNDPVSAAARVGAELAVRVGAYLNEVIDAMAGGVGPGISDLIQAQAWCPCWLAYADSSRCVPERCPHRFPSRHPGLWVDQIRDHCHGGD